MILQKAHVSVLFQQGSVFSQDAILVVQAHVDDAQVLIDHVQAVLDSVKSLIDEAQVVLNGVKTLAHCV
ncbi:hypothetical protein TC41_0213 [Alicyclobacillus acidocaldarius subsp. acidocaldarius Tc-4-1]|uniref:Uncharacterized protein n=1 Tax=Alicyclobacillus acidocaldarius (strain Tc-4-1) TaxID=1048834 RepID=F8IJ38_ALIAT|nr:hypothetical protein TC41_0213 [Alicyclobacillus acidocaldarius subsp. acidocaldarius Tc-4-1]